MSSGAAIAGTRVSGIDAPPLPLQRLARWIAPALALFLATFVLMAPVHAQGHGGGGSPHDGGGSHGGPPHGDWHGGGHDWHGGRDWQRGGHDWHGGGGSVFLNFGLSEPYYPYAYAPYPYYYPPDYYAPPTYYLPAPAPPVSAPPAVAALPPSWYYCDNPQGYYPYVATCPGGWRQVPAQPQ